MKKRRVTSLLANDEKVSSQYAKTPYDIKRCIFSFFDVKELALKAGVNNEHAKLSREVKQKCWNPESKREIDKAIPPRFDNPQAPLEGQGLRDVTYLDLSNANENLTEDQLIRILNRLRETLLYLDLSYIFKEDSEGEISVTLTEAILEQIFSCPRLEELIIHDCLFDSGAAKKLADLKNLKALTISQCYNMNEKLLFTKCNDSLERLECDSISITKNVGNLFNLQSLWINNIGLCADERSPWESTERERAIANLKYLPEKPKSGHLTIYINMPNTLNILLEFLKNVPGSVDNIEFYVENDDEQPILFREGNKVDLFESLPSVRQDELNTEVSGELRRLQHSGCQVLISDWSSRNPMLDFVQGNIQQTQIDQTSLASCVRSGGLFSGTNRSATSEQSNEPFHGESRINSNDDEMRFSVAG